MTLVAIPIECGAIAAGYRKAYSVEYLVVAGGGSGGSGNFFGGAGAGGYRTGTLTLLPGFSYSAVVGAGGASAYTPPSGSNRSFGGITSAGGGGAGRGRADNIPAKTGGSGGGAGGLVASGAYPFLLGAAGDTPSTAPSQGNAGGNSSGIAPAYGAGGGGGAGGVGGNGSNTAGGNGGNGTQSSISGTPTYYAGGGGGASNSGGATNGQGGLGGGGTAGSSAGTANTGGGGGSGFAGGSGIVILRYLTADPPVLPSGGTITTSGAYTIHTFTSTGTFRA